ncbi:helix-turn-helix domain-containing protein [Desulfopila aestuarii]|uniref:helix-turn-helix domain-containing protein n=1 Tax=Desulfopila aestuarii TaxID=231440 RepID=UPI00190EFF88|nr:winged helix-turn-helix domain-containing protein [Desulfopila aestuarii]
MLVEKNPQQLKLLFALWTRKAIQSVVYQMWRVRMAIRTIGDYRKRWGFTPQKPFRKAYEQSPKAVQEWLDVTYPKIKSRAAAEKAEIYWGEMRPEFAMIVSRVEITRPVARPLLLQSMRNVFHSI